MGKWTCQCGEAMNDHQTPDPNAFSVYSDERWEEIINKADEQNKIDYFDLSDATFYMWKCPKCGSFMAFDEDSNPRRYTFYRRETFEEE